MMLCYTWIGLFSAFLYSLLELKLHEGKDLLPAICLEPRTEPGTWEALAEELLNEGRNSPVGSSQQSLVIGIIILLVHVGNQSLRSPCY